MIDDLVKEAAAAHPVDAWRNQARYTTALGTLNQQFGSKGPGGVDQSLLANNPEYYSGLRTAYDDYLASGSKSTAAEKAPKVISVAK